MMKKMIVMYIIQQQTKKQDDNQDTKQDIIQTMGLEEYAEQIERLSTSKLSSLGIDLLNVDKLDLLERDRLIPIEHFSRTLDQCKDLLKFIDHRNIQYTNTLDKHTKPSFKNINDTTTVTNIDIIDNTTDEHWKPISFRENNVQSAIYDLLESGPMTFDEIAEALGNHYQENQIKNTLATAIEPVLETPQNKQQRLHLKSIFKTTIYPRTHIINGSIVKNLFNEFLQDHCTIYHINPFFSPQFDSTSHLKFQNLLNNSSSSNSKKTQEGQSSPATPVEQQPTTLEEDENEEDETGEEKKVKKRIRKGKKIQREEFDLDKWKKEWVDGSFDVNPLSNDILLHQNQPQLPRVASTRKRGSTEPITASQPAAAAASTMLPPVVGRSKKQKVIETQPTPPTIIETEPDISVSQPQISSGYNFFSSQNTVSQGFGGSFSMDPFASQSTRNVFEDHQESSTINESTTTTTTTTTSSSTSKRDKKDKSKKDKKEKKKEKREKRKQQEQDTSDQTEQPSSQQETTTIFQESIIQTQPSTQSYNFFSTPFSFDQQSNTTGATSQNSAWDLPSFTGDSNTPAVIDPNEHSYSFFSSYYNHSQYE